MSKTQSDPSLQWWQNALIYQIYPLSFNAPQGGYGTLRGIIDKVDYIADLGVDAVWFSPFFKSPMTIGMGYNPSDYYHVEETFGTDAECREMIDKLHAKGVKVIFDMVFNHTAQEHPWFAASADPNHLQHGLYKDFYIWADPAPGEGPPETRFPNNWPSVTPMQGSDGRAWKWNPERKQFYLHSFAENMPDLNLQNPLVRDELKKVMEHWREQGVDGFRCDAVPHYFKAGIPENGHASPGVAGQNGIYQPENQSCMTPKELERWAHRNDDEDKRPKDIEKIDWADKYFDNMRYQDGKAVLQDLFGGLPEGVGVIGEADAGWKQQERVNEYLDSGVRQCYLGKLPNPRNTEKNPHNTEEFVKSVKGAVHKFGLDRVNFTGGNHDSNRMVSLWGLEEYGARGAAFAAALTLSLPGSHCIFQGDELGLPDDNKAVMQRKGSPEWQHRYDTKGLAASMYDSEVSRGMIPWIKNQLHNGWVSISQKLLDLAVDVQEKDAGSTLNYYRQFIKFRAEQPALLRGDIAFDMQAAKEGIIKFTRECKGEQKLECVFNTNDLTVSITPMKRGHMAHVEATRGQHDIAPHL